MNVNVYEICQTDNPEQLNGKIIIIELDKRIGYAVVIVSEERKEHANTITIQSTDRGRSWSGIFDPKGRNQKWEFWINQQIDPDVKYTTNDRYDRNDYYRYMKYNISGTVKQGNGSGTAGGD